MDHDTGRKARLREVGEAGPAQREAAVLTVCRLAADPVSAREVLEMLGLVETATRMRAAMGSVG